MQKLTSILNDSIFKKPNMTEEEWAENDRNVYEWEKECNDISIKARINNSGIPDAFINAKLGYSIEIAEFAGNPNVGLLIQGKTGRGKTYQACAVLLSAASIMTVRFTTFDDLIRECKATFNNYDTEQQVISR